MECTIDWLRFDALSNKQIERTRRGVLVLHVCSGFTTGAAPRRSFPCR